MYFLNRYCYFIIGITHSHYKYYNHFKNDNSFNNKYKSNTFQVQLTVLLCVNSFKYIILHIMYLYSI